MADSAASKTGHPSRGFRLVPWIVPRILATSFLMAGFMKATQPVDQLAATMGWPRDIPAFLFHIPQGEYSSLPLNAAFAVLTALVAWGRFSRAPTPGAGPDMTVGIPKARLRAHGNPGDGAGRAAS